MEYLEVRRALRIRNTQNTQFFVFSDGSPVKDTHIRSVLHKMIKNLRLNPKYYNIHSFRIGRATDLSKDGLAVEKIKKQGRWKSNAVYRYLRD